MALLMIGVNIGFYLLPFDYRGLGDYAIAGVFALTAIATATIVVPVPYIPIVIHLAQQSTHPRDLVLIALAAGLGSVVGETSGYLVGRAGSSAVTDTRMARWVAEQMTHPVRSFVTLFALSAPPNPLFDVAGIAAGAFRVPFWRFASAVCAGRCVRMAGIILVGLWLPG
jgi:membrane protein YqaA with SNARE-associated domain